MSIIDDILANLATGATRATAGTQAKHVPLAKPRHPITHRVESARLRMRRLGRERTASQQIEKLPTAGEHLMLLMTGNFHGWDFVGAVLDLAQPATIDHLHIATLGFNRQQAGHLADLLDRGTVGAVTMLVSEMFRDKNKAEYADIHRLLVDERGQCVACTRNHAKLLCFALSDGRRLALHGSLNLRRCNSYEQAMLSHDADLHRFFTDYIEGQATP